MLTSTLSAAHPALAQPITVPSDPRASYQALQVTPRRGGPSGTSYALREVDCRSDRFRYLGEGDTREAALRRASRDALGPLFEGSISWHVARFACGRAVR